MCKGSLWSIYWPLNMLPDRASNSCWLWRYDRLDSFNTYWLASIRLVRAEPITADATYIALLCGIQPDVKHSSEKSTFPISRQYNLEFPGNVSWDHSTCLYSLVIFVGHAKYARLYRVEALSRLNRYRFYSVSIPGLICRICFMYRWGSRNPSSYFSNTYWNVTPIRTNTVFNTMLKT